MPIYAYKCESCGHAKDVLQKMSDAPLSVCPLCGAETFKKQLTAAGFQLKGSGWYVTDFRGSNSAEAAAKSADVPASGTAAVAPAASATSGNTTSAGTAPASAPTPAASASATPKATP
ncbi:MAG: zinc ribbon domain-containing protein [Polaromonas sp.]|nr:zinc ribbon domain-containing protein [Polaromonas sp.]